MFDRMKSIIRRSAESHPADGEPSRGKRIALRILKGLAAFCMMMVIAVCLFGSVMTIYVIKYVDPTVSTDISNLKQTTQLLAWNEETQNYEVTAELYGEENRIWVDIGDVPLVIQHVAVASEDKRFYQHHGVDWWRTIGSFGNLIFGYWGNRQGGSTITQQLIKNVTEDDEISIERKVQEIMRALNLEKEVSKDIILEAYLNTIFLGYGCNGLQSAANFYFGKDVSELTVAEAASIMAITRYPTANNPILHPEKNRQVYTYTLKTMLEQGWLTQEEYEEAVNQELVFTAQSSIQNIVKIHSWYEDQVITDVIADLQQQYGYTETRAKWMLYNGGLRVYMCVDQEVQQSLENQYYNPANFLKENYDDQPQSAMVVMGYDGKVLGLIGGKGEKTGNLLWNRATRSKRHPGSSIKPLAAYSLAVEYDLIYWSKKILDAPITLYEGEKVSNWPKNYYSGFLGLITVDEAIQRSTNTVPAKVVQELTPEVCFDFCYNKLKMTSLISGERRNGQYFTDIALAPLSMGSPTDGVTLLEMAAGYQMFGNGGFYCEPYTYSKVVDSSGQIILENKSTPTRVISEDTSVVMCKLLQRVVTGSHGTGKRASQLNFPVAAKTGTSTSYNDRWFIGLTPYYIGVVWTGYDQAKEMDESLPNPSLDAWLKVMKPIHENKPDKDFPSSDQVEQRTYCTASGLIANGNCPSTAKGWYKKSSFVPICDQH